MPSPTAFISYSHETSEHNDRVRDLAIRLRDAGIECVVDLFEESPPEGWSKWCSHQVRECDFCIIVCTETYARRFDGDEAPGVGRGATWEGKIIRQCLYFEPDGRRFIPVFFDGDKGCIPFELQDVSHYDVSLEVDYDRLYRRLTDQAEFEPRPVGSIRKYLPRVGARLLSVVALLHLCPRPIPIGVVARATGQDVPTLKVALQESVETGVVAAVGDTISVADRSVGGVPALSRELMCSALKVLLERISRDTRSLENRVQVINAVTLIRALDDGNPSVDVSRAFGVIQSLLKSLGNKRLVLEIARASIRASKADTVRGTAQAQDEALATICGVSWVYQRTERLREARIEAENSLTLGRNIGWDRNTAFCMKCLGRLRRLEAEDAKDGAERAALLNESTRLLRDAIERFRVLELELEIGDCYSLLARSYIVAGARSDAWEAIREAERRLVETGSKDHLDLLITRGDLAAFRDLVAAESEYDKVVNTADESDAQKSEVVARAYHQRGLVRARLGDETKALADFRRAAGIWDGLEDPSADAAHWQIERRAEWIPGHVESLIENESLGVRVQVARLVKQRRADRGAVAARRGSLPGEYVRELIRDARTTLAVERPKW